MALVLKTSWAQALTGSNPVASAIASLELGYGSATLKLRGSERDEVRQRRTKAGYYNRYVLYLFAEM